jgi:hypothetical protein
MGRNNQDTVTAFAEVLSSSGIAGSQNNRTVTNDNRLMVYFQGMKLYISDGFQPDTLLKLLQVMKKL